ncbi:Aggrecan core [Gossypium arboreum]|uniref:Aggrecan core n=1 Tax=Gossypium arboreum TaxID=29729 RepID=A0A0B0P4A4_GOSAR|nr:Aggrecan core [Gossypium arboreum]
MIHGRVSPSADIKRKSVCSTRSHTRACDQPCGVAWLSTRPGRRVCLRPCDVGQYVCSISTRPKTRVSLLAV